MKKIEKFYDFNKFFDDTVTYTLNDVNGALVLKIENELFSPEVYDIETYLCIGATAANTVDTLCWLLETIFNNYVYIDTHKRIENIENLPTDIKRRKIEAEFVNNEETYGVHYTGELLGYELDLFVPKNKEYCDAMHKEYEEILTFLNEDIDYFNAPSPKIPPSDLADDFSDMAEFFERCFFIDKINLCDLLMDCTLVKEITNKAGKFYEEHE